MPALILRSELDEALGFLLIAGSDFLEHGESAQYCVLTGIPQSSAALDHPLSQARLAHLHEEHRAMVETRGELLQISVGVATSGTLEITINKDSGDGTWRFDSKLGITQGRASLAKPRKR